MRRYFARQSGQRHKKRGWGCALKPACAPDASPYPRWAGPLQPLRQMINLLVKCPSPAVRIAARIPMAKHCKQKGGRPTRQDEDCPARALPLFGLDLLSCHWRLMTLPASGEFLQKLDRKIPCRLVHGVNTSVASANHPIQPSLSQKESTAKRQNVSQGCISFFCNFHLICTYAHMH